MKIIKLYLIGLLFLIGFNANYTACALAVNGVEAEKVNAVSSTFNNPSFVENKGQYVDVDGNHLPDVLYKIQLPGLDAYLRKDGISFVLMQTEKIAEDELNKEYDDILGLDKISNNILHAYRLDLEFKNTNSNVTIEPQGQVEAYTNYYYGHCPDGITGVNSFEKLIYKNLYDGIDLIFYTKEIDGVLRLKYDLRVHPGADPDLIQYQYISDQLNLAITKDMLAINTPLGEFKENLGEVFQEKKGLKETVKGNYKINEGLLSFEVKSYDFEKELIIDPFFTYYGTSSGDEGTDITSDGNNQVVVCGIVQGAGLPVAGTGYQQNYTNRADMFVIKLDDKGNRIWSTYYGGNDDSDRPLGITVDGGNNIFMVGITFSDDFPVTSPGAFAGSSEGAILSFDENGVRRWALYFGGNVNESFLDVAIDQNNNILTCGFSSSVNLPVVGCFPSSYQGGTNSVGDGFIASFNNNSGNVQWSTYIGGSNNEYCNGIAVDNNNSVIVTGKTNSSDFVPAITGVRKGGWDVFVIKYNDNCGLQWGELFGGTEPAGQEEEANAIAVDLNNNDIIITGETAAPDFPIINGRDLGVPSTFLTKLDEDGNMIWSTHYEGYTGNDIKTEANGKFWITGIISTVDLSTNFASFQQNYGGGTRDAFVANIDADGITTLCATYYGGNSIDEGNGIALDNIGNVLITGRTGSSNLPGITPSSIQQNRAGGTDAFIASICTNCGLPQDTSYIANEDTLVYTQDTVFFCLGDTTHLMNLFDFTSKNNDSTVLYTGNYFDWFNVTDAIVADVADPTVKEVAIDNSWIKVSPTDTTTYRLISSAADCRYDTNYVVLSPIPPPTAQFTLLEDTITICEEDTAFLEIALTGIANWNITLCHYDYNSVLLSYDTLLTDTNNIITNLIEMPVTDTGWYKICRIEDQACDSIDQDSIYIQWYDLPKLTLINDTNLCGNDSVKLVANFSGNGVNFYDFDYKFKGATGVTTDKSFAGTYNELLNFYAKDSGIYYSMYLTDSLCTDTIKDTAVVNIFKKPSFNILQPTNDTLNICEGGTDSIHIKLKGFPNFKFYYERIYHDINDDLVIDSLEKVVATGLNVLNYQFSVSDTGWYKFYQLDDLYCDSIFRDSVYVDYYPTSALNILADENPICTGDSTNLNFTMTGDGPFDVVLTNPVLPALSFVAQNNPYAVRVGPIITTTYTATNITDVHGCETSINEQYNLVVHDTPKEVSRTITCDGINDSIRIVVELKDGDVNSYHANGILPGINIGDDTNFGTGTNSHKWTSNWIVEGNYEIQFFDDNHCDTLVISGTHICPCETDAGVMTDLTEQKLCEDASTSPFHDGNQVLDDNDVFSFALSTVNPPVNAADILVWSNNGVIGYDPGIMTCDVTYYLLAIAGNDDGVNQVNFTDPCLAMTDAIPVLWRTYPTANFVENDFSVCEGEDAIYSIDTTGCIGTNIEFYLNATWTSVTAYNYPLNATEINTIDSVRYIDNPTCESVVNDVLNITMLTTPTVSNVTRTCNSANTHFTVQFDINGGQTPYYVRDVINGTYGVSGNPFISDPIASSGAYDYYISDGNKCDSVRVYGNFECDCATRAGAIAINPQTMCLDGQSFVIVTDPWTNDGNDAFEFVLHNKNPFVVGDVILDRNNNGIFTVGDRDCGKPYYITGIAGNEDGANLGQVDTTDGCFSRTAAVKVTWRCVPNASFADEDFDACIGTNINTNVNLFPAGNNMDVKLNGVWVSGNTAYAIPPFVLTADTQFIINEVKYTNGPSCSENIKDTLIITALETPTATLNKVICNYNNDSIQITVDINGGHPSSYVAFGPSSAGGTFNGTKTEWTSDWLSPGVYDVSFNDQNNCGNSRITDTYNCPCVTRAGAIAVNEQVMCIDGLTSMIVTDPWTNDGNDQFEFILHEFNPFKIGDDILDRNKTGQFALGNRDCNIAYYVTGIAGNEDITNPGQVDTLDACFSQTGNAKVTWRCVPSASFDDEDFSVCKGTNIKANISLTPANENIELEVNGSWYGDVNNHLYDATIDSDTTFYIQNIRYADAPKCPSNILDSLVISLHDTIKWVNTTINCDDTNENYTVTVEVTGGNEDYNYNDNSAPLGTFISQNGGVFEFSFKNNNSYDLEFFDTNNCNVVKVKGTHDCPCTNDAGSINLAKADVCDGNDVQVLEDVAPTLDENDIVGYLLHNGTGYADLDRIFYSVSNFPKPLAYAYNTVYYVSAVVGNDNGNGEVDNNDRCLKISADVPVIFREIPDATVTGYPDNLLCIGEDGVMQFKFTKGVEPYTVTGDSIFTLVYQNDLKTVVSTSQSTTYSFWEVSDNYCVANINQSVDFVVPDSVKTNPDIVPISCFGLADGSINLNVTGGHGTTYSYQWFNNNGTVNMGVVNDNVSNLAPDTYRVVVTDENNCTTEDNFTLISPPELTIDLIDIINETCFQENDGQITVVAPNGEEFKNPMDGMWVESGLFVNMHFESGSNQLVVSVRDQNNCQVDSTISVAGLNPISWVQTPQDVVVCPNVPVIVKAEATGGNEDFTYHWGEDSTKNVDYEVFPNITTEYCVIAKDANGCPSTEECVTVTLPDVLTLEKQFSADVCIGDTGYIYIEALGGAPPYTSQITNLRTNEVYTERPITIIGEESETYEITMEDECNTILIDSVFIHTPPAIHVDVLIEDTAGCVPFKPEIENRTIAQDFTWESSNGYVTKNTEPNFKWHIPGDYQITLQAEDTYGCTNQETFKIHVFSNAIADFEFVNKEMNPLKPETGINNYSQFADEYNWIVDSLGEFTDESPYLLFPPLTSGGIYKVCLEALNVNGCNDYICKELIIPYDHLIHVPNAFSPLLNDGINDVFIPVLSSDNINLYSLMIHDRWGEKLFETNDHTMGWDGTYKNTPVKPDTYTWDLTIRFAGEATIRKHAGFVVIGQ